VVTQAQNTPASVTAEALTFPVDYNDGTAVDPPSWAKFTKQAQITQFLAAHSTSNFKHLQAVIEATPDLVNHEITINLAAGVHRPRTGQPGYSAWAIKKTLGAKFIVNGSLPSAWTAEVGLGSLPVDSYQAGSGDPWLDFSSSNPGIFTGMDLKGLYVVLSTGQTAVIHDHTDDRLFVLSAISPSPVGGTAKVAHPSTILRDSLDDINYEYYYALEVSCVTTDPFGADIDISNIRFQQPVLNVVLIIEDGITRFTRTEVDCITYPTSGYGVLSENPGWFSYFTDCSILGTPSTSVGIYEVEGTIQIFRTFMRGFGTLVWAGHCSYSAAGTVMYDSSIGILADSTIIELYDYGWGSKINEMRGITGQAINLDSSRFNNAYTYFYCNFKNCTGPLFRFGSNCVLNMPAMYSVGLTNSGGNTDVGFELVGADSTLRLTSGANGATGTLGDVRMSDGEILSYSTILTQGPFTDTNLNLVQKTS
jgi:hypothetical protein